MLQKAEPFFIHVSPLQPNANKLFLQRENSTLVKIKPGTLNNRQEH